MRGIYVESRSSGPAFYVWSMCIPSGLQPPCARARIRLSLRIGVIGQNVLMDSRIVPVQMLSIALGSSWGPNFVVGRNVLMDSRAYPVHPMQMNPESSPCFNSEHEQCQAPRVRGQDGTERQDRRGGRSDGFASPAGRPQRTGSTTAQSCSRPSWTCLLYTSDAADEL